MLDTYDKETKPTPVTWENMFDTDDRETERLYNCSSPSTRNT